MKDGKTGKFRLLPIFAEKIRWSKTKCITCMQWSRKVYTVRWNLPNNASNNLNPTLWRLRVWGNQVKRIEVELFYLRQLLMNRTYFFEYLFLKIVFWRWSMTFLAITTILSKRRSWSRVCHMIVESIDRTKVRRSLSDFTGYIFTIWICFGGSCGHSGIKTEYSHFNFPLWFWFFWVGS